MFAISGRGHYERFAKGRPTSWGKNPFMKNKQLLPRGKAFFYRRNPRGTSRLSFYRGKKGADPA